MSECIVCGEKLEPKDEHRLRDDEDEILIFCGFEHVEKFLHARDFVRGVDALESIAASLEKMTKPRAPKAMPPGLAKCPECVAVIPKGLVEQHCKEVHRPPEPKRSQPPPPKETRDGDVPPRRKTASVAECPNCANLIEGPMSDHFRFCPDRNVS